MLTAVHIINRLPSAAINFKVPYEQLKGEAVNYDELKVFGCLAMVYNATHGGDKLQQGAFRVFLLDIQVGQKAIEC